MRRSQSSRSCSWTACRCTPSRRWRTIPSTPAFWTCVSMFTARRRARGASNGTRATWWIGPALADDRAPGRHRHPRPPQLAPLLHRSRYLPASPPTPQVDGKEAKDIELATALDDKPLIKFEETVQRPLFHADRKPIERKKEVAEAPAPASLNTGMRLVGIVKSAGAPGRALIRFAGEPIGKWVPEGG